MKDVTGYPFGGYDGSDESFEHLQDQAPPARYECGDCGGEITPGHQVEQRYHLDDRTPQCRNRRDAVRRKPGHFCCLECGQPPDCKHLKKCTDSSGRSGGMVEKFRAELTVNDGSPDQWYSNNIEYDDWLQAEEAARRKAWSWSAVTRWRVVPVSTPRNQPYEAGSEGGR